MAFNHELSLYKNIQLSLWQHDKTIDNMAKELQTTSNSIKTTIARKFQRADKSSPLDKKVFKYLQKHSQGFSEYCQANSINIVS